MKLTRNSWKTGELLAPNPETGTPMRFTVFAPRSPWNDKHAILADLYGINCNRVHKKVSIHPFYYVTGDAVGLSPST